MRALAFTAIAALALSAAPALPREPAWNGKADGPAWTAAAESAVEPLLALTPADVTAFCPGYAVQTPDQRREFWVEFLASLAQSESRLEPRRSTWRLFDSDVKRPTFRRGLLQVSIESARRPDYGCEASTVEALLQPGPNLACGARILAARVGTAGVIAGKGSEGAAGYWPSLAKASSRRAIQARTSALPDCRPASP